MHGPVPLLHDYLQHSAARLPDKVALVCQGRRHTYAELDRDADALAATLAAAGVARGDRVLVFGDNTVETVVAFWAVLKASAVAVVVNPLTKTDKLRYLIDDCRPAALVTDAHLQHVWAGPAQSPHLRLVVSSGAVGEAVLAKVPHVRRFADATNVQAASLPRRCLDVDLAAIVYTSGSTGDPKGVMLSHRNMLTAATSVSSYLRMAEDDVVLNVLPLAFDYGLYQMLMAFRLGARLVLERSFAFPAQVIKVMLEERVTGFPGVPTIFAILSELKTLRPEDFAGVRYVSNTAAALPQKHIDMLRRLFANARIYSMYGLTECKRCTFLPPEDLDRKPGSVGIAIPNTELWLVDEHDRRLGPGQTGQLVIRGATVMQGYWEKPAATAEKLKPGPLPGERVLYTGDLCRLDDDGYLYFVARMDDVIKSRGEKVAPKEVEAVLVGIDGVREAAVVGVPDEVLGHAVKAFVVLEQGASLTQKQIQLACQDKLENFMVPKFVELVAELPKTDTGKIKKAGLR